MLYPNNINARMGIEAITDDSYKAYLNQRRILLQKSENDFSSEKRSRGTVDYNGETFNFKYPVFKTPFFDKADFVQKVKDGIEAADKEADKRLDLLKGTYTLVYEEFKKHLPVLTDKYAYLFSNLENLITNKYAIETDPQKKQDILKEITDETSSLIDRFTCAGEREVILNERLNESRRKYYRNLISPKKGERTPPFPASRPFYKVKKLYEDSDIWSTFKNMPKGGLLHMHTSSSVTPEWILDTLVNASENKNDCGASYVVLDKDPHKYGKLTFKEPEGGAYAKVTRRLLYEENDGALGRELIQLMSFGSDRIDSIDYIWDEFNNCFSKTDDLLKNPKFYEAYYTEAFKQLVDDNVEYLELRSNFAKFDDEDTDEEHFLRLLMEAEKNANDYAKKQATAHIYNNERKFKLRIILCGNRSKSRKFDVISKMVKAVKLSCIPEYSDYIIGFDIVSEEDRGCNTAIYTQFIISSQIYKFINFYFHDGETSWQFNTNMADAYMLSNRRVGHGFGIHSFPNLTDDLSYEQDTPIHKTVDDTVAASVNEYCKIIEKVFEEIGTKPELNTDEKKITYLIGKITEKIDYAKKDETQLGAEQLKPEQLDEIRVLRELLKNEAFNGNKKTYTPALEICPISNQMLRYTPDLRLHPAVTLMHRGVQCVLANDDPQIFGNIGLTYDFISAFMAWNLDIWQIKQLIVNSLVYSAIPRDENSIVRNNAEDKPYSDIVTALSRFNVLWHIFLFEEVPELSSVYCEIKKDILNNIEKDKPDINIQEKDQAFQKSFADLGLKSGCQRHMIEDKDYVLQYDDKGITDDYINYLST